MLSLFKKRTFKPQNGFSTLAYFATENQINHQKLKYPHGKLECFIFYSTYISLLTSTQYPQYADKVDQLLVNGIWGFRDFLMIQESPDIEFPEFVENRGKLYMECIDEILQNFNGRDGAVIPTFVMLFETNEIIELDEVNMSDLFKIMSAFVVVKSNIELINTAYNQCAQVENISVNLNPEGFISQGSELFKQLAVLPFRKPRCQGCGNLMKRDELALTTVNDEDGCFLMPMCSRCIAKYGYQSGNSI